MSICLLFASSLIISATPAPRERFVTGFRQRPIELVPPELTREPRSSTSITPFLAEGFRYAEYVANLAAGSSGGKTTLHIPSWRAFCTLGPWLSAAGRSGHANTLLAAQSLPDFLEAIYPGELGGHAEPEDLARVAMKYFRENWLYDSSDAQLFARVETWLAEHLRAWGGPIDVSQLTFILTGNATASRSDCDGALGGKS